VRLAVRSRTSADDGGTYEAPGLAITNDDVTFLMTRHLKAAVTYGHCKELKIHANCRQFSPRGVCKYYKINEVVDCSTGGTEVVDKYMIRRGHG